MPQPQESKPTRVNEILASINAKGRSGAELEPHEEELKRKMELLARVRVGRESRAASRGKVQNPKPGKDYIWVNRSESRQLEYQSMGYELCTDPDIITQENFKQPDNTHHRGDLVLYSIDKELREVLHYDDVTRGLEMLETPAQTFATEAEKEGARFYQPPPR